MKKSISMLAIWIQLLLLIVIYGCGVPSAKLPTGKMNNMDAVLILPQDDQYYLKKPSASYISMAESDSGYYFFSGTNDMYLYYMDKQTMKSVVLCNKPDCFACQ